jgi:succinoglycan biosynthesis protein ExoM
MTVSVCIATFRRPENLALLLTDLLAQKRLPMEVVIVDNDADASARPVIEQLIRSHRGSALPFSLHYDVQPQQNISLTRNQTVELACGRWLAFLDDDERVPTSWLRELMETVELHSADGALGPVVPLVPKDAPSWIRRGRFYDWARMKTGAIVPRNRLRFGNVVLRASLLQKYSAPFDPAYGLTGGEDGDLLTRLAIDGARIVWCDEAVVHEPIVASRLSLRWLLRRALRGGQDFARHFLTGRYGESNKRPNKFARINFIARAGAQSTIALALTVVCLPMGRHAAAFWLLKAAANIGKITLFFGAHYQEYARAAAAREFAI